MAEHFVVMEYEDRPGIVAAYGAAFGEAEINIAGMQIARTTAGGTALSIITIDQAAPDALVERLGAQIAAKAIRQIEIREL
jgi:D-3-phosphoglycerate dehydrogenase / 2-oxoglutarate reductase